MAEVHDPALGLVGQIKSVQLAAVEEALAAGRVPVLTSLGLSAAGASLLAVVSSHRNTHRRRDRHRLAAAADIAGYHSLLHRNYTACVHPMPCLQARR